MSQRRNIEFLTVSITPEARDALRRLAYAVSISIADRVSMSDAIFVAERLVAMHDLSASLGSVAREVLGDDR